MAAFNIFAHNRDDHSKNFSFLMDGKGLWKLAPAYDLTFSNSAYGFHSTMVAGESENPGKKDILKLGEYFGVKNTQKIIDEVRDAVSQWDNIANDCSISKKTRNDITKALNHIK